MKGLGAGGCAGALSRLRIVEPCARRPISRSLTSRLPRATTDTLERLAGPRHKTCDALVGEAWPISPTARGDLLAINRRPTRSVSVGLRDVGKKLGASRQAGPDGLSGTDETSMPGLPYGIAVSLVPADAAEIVAILRVIHTARDWSPGAWLGGMGRSRRSSYQRTAMW